MVRDFISESLIITVWLDRPGPTYDSVNWNGTPGVVNVKFGLLFRSNPVHVDVTPSMVIDVLVVSLGDKLLESI